MITLESYVLDRWQAGTGTPAVLRDPTTEEALAEVSSEGIDLAAVLAHGRTVGGPALRALGFAKRAELLMGLSKAIHAHREELIELSMQNAGTTRGDAKFIVSPN
jgi:oxepin-CoA hydrolase/3-oxo-5,6-dehydrosuberyl-CoA semialdehyde dehydrogenase